MGIEGGKSFSRLTAGLVAAGVLCAGNARAQAIDVPGEERPVPKVPEGVPETVSPAPEFPDPVGDAWRKYREDYIREFQRGKGNYDRQFPSAVGKVELIGPERTPYQQGLDGVWDACADAYTLNEFEVDALLREVTNEALRVIEPNIFPDGSIGSASVSKVLACNKGVGGKSSPSTAEIAKCVSDEAKNNPRSGFRNDTFDSIITRSFHRPLDTDDVIAGTEHCILDLRKSERQREVLFRMRERFRAHVDEALRLYRKDLSPDALKSYFDAVRGKKSGKK